MKNLTSYKATIFIVLFLCITYFSFSQAPEIEWQNTIGGISGDYLNSIQQTTDGGYILGGNSYSGISDDKTEASLGGSDYWVVKLDSIGNIEWQNTIGGIDHDYLNSIQQTTDGGYILGGWTYSGISGDKTEENWDEVWPYSPDYWVVKLDSLGNIEWDNSIGGSGWDVLTSLQQTTDGGYILGGYSRSNISGDKTENSYDVWDEYYYDYVDAYDYWVVKLDSIGSIQWQNTIGGNDNDELTSIQQTADGGYILGGYSPSEISGDKTEESLGWTDYWVIKLDNIGNIQWQNTIGGSDYDGQPSIQQTTDGGYILGGTSTSPISGDKTEASMGDEGDCWVLKLDSMGNIQWQNTIGGSEEDYLNSIQQTTDGGYILGGSSASDISGDKTEENWDEVWPYTHDYWVIKLDSIGNIQSQNTIGGGEDDWLPSIQKTTDGGYILGGYSLSGISGDKTEPSLGGYDYWVIKLECIVLNTFYADADGDGFGNMLDSIAYACNAPLGYVLTGGDCDDSNFAVNPAATEICDAIDNNCDGAVDEGLPVLTFYADADGDNYGNISIDTLSCNETISGYVTDNSDCDDSNFAINPAATEICDAIDNNCDGAVDEGLPVLTFYADADGDSYGNIFMDSLSCYETIAGYVTDNSDCDDTNATIYPGASEILDGVDNNCNGEIDEGLTDIEETLSNALFTLYPNPANNIITIKTEQFTDKTIYVTNAFGQIVQTIITSENTISINLNNISSGIYFIKMEDGINSTTQKFIKL